MVDFDLSISEDLGKKLSEINSLKNNLDKTRVLFEQWRKRYEVKNGEVFNLIKKTNYKAELKQLISSKGVIKGLYSENYKFWDVLFNVVASIPLHYKTEVFYTSVRGRQYCVSKRGLVVKNSVNAFKSTGLDKDDFAILMTEYSLIVKGLSNDKKFVNLKKLLVELKDFFVETNFLVVKNNFSIFKGISSFVFNSSSKEFFVFRKAYGSGLAHIDFYSNSVMRSIDCSWYSPYDVVNEFNLLISIKDRLIELLNLDFNFSPIFDEKLLRNRFKKYLLFKNF